MGMRRIAVLGAAALACAKTLAGQLGIEAQLKWPNDVLVGERRLRDYWAKRCKAQ